LSSGSPPKKVSAKLVEPSASSLAYPLGGARRGLERHFRGVLVVLPVIALDAVITGEVALQRRQHRDAQLTGVLADVPEELLQRLALRGAALDHEAVGREGIDRVLFGRGERVRPIGRAIEHVGHLPRHDQLRIGEGVHQEQVVGAVDRHTDIEHRGLHARTSRRLRG
jgi:hypothetical protein